MFQNVTATIGPTYRGRNWGAAWGDINNDGLPDLWVSKHNSHSLEGGAADISLYLNRNGRFFDVTSQRVDLLQKDFHGSAWADFDNDGDKDLAQVSGGVTTGGVTLFVNNDRQLDDETIDRGLGPTRQTAGRNVLWFDYDNDGRLDIFLGADQVSTGGSSGLPATVLRQTAAHRFVDVRAQVGMTVNSALGPLLADLTGDGRPELIITHYGAFTRIYDTTGPQFRNIQGQLLSSIDIPKFDDIAIADFNNDTLPDIYLTRRGFTDEVSVQGNTLRSYIIQEDGRKAFTFATAGNVTYTFSRQDGTIDYNDIHVGRAGRQPITDQRNPVFTLSAADQANTGIAPHGPNDPGIYIGYDANAQRWRYEVIDSATARGVVIDSTAAIRNVETVGFPLHPVPLPDQLLINTGSGFVDRSVWSGIAAMSISGQYVTTGDFDNDGDVDIYIDQAGAASNRPNILLQNQGNATFVRVQGADGAAGPTSGRGGPVMTADYNQDGFLDILATSGASEPPFNPLNNDGPLSLFRNQGNGNHWVEVRLHGTQSNAEGIGAKVTVTLDNTVQAREAIGGQHIAAQDFSDLHFGLGGHTVIDRMLVEWPSGMRTVLHNVAADRLLNIVEGQGLAASPADSLDAADPMLFGPDDGDPSTVPESSSDGADTSYDVAPGEGTDLGDLMGIAGSDWLLG